MYVYIHIHKIHRILFIQKHLCKLLISYCYFALHGVYNVLHNYIFYSYRINSELGFY